MGWAAYSGHWCTDVVAGFQLVTKNVLSSWLNLRCCSVVIECHKHISIITVTGAGEAMKKASYLCLLPQCAIFSRSCCVCFLALHTDFSICLCHSVEDVAVCFIRTEVAEEPQPTILLVKILALKNSLHLSQVLTSNYKLEMIWFCITKRINWDSFGGISAEVLESEIS